MKKLLLQQGTMLALCVIGAAFFNFQFKAAAVVFWILAIISFFPFLKTLRIGNVEIIDFSELDKTRGYMFFEKLYDIVIIDILDTETLTNIRVKNFPKEHRSIRPYSTFFFSSDGEIKINPAPIQGHIKQQGV